MNHRSFFLVTAVVGLALWAAGRFVLPLIIVDIDRFAVDLAVAAAVVVSTGGWLIAGRGLDKEPVKFPAYFVAGLLVKLALLGVAVLLVSATGAAGFTEFLVLFASAWVVLGMAQMVNVALQAIGKLEAHRVRDRKNEVGE